LPLEAALHQGIEAEGREVTFVENDRMAQGDGTAVVRLVIDQVEQPFRAGTVPQVPIDQTLTVSGGHACHLHDYSRTGAPEGTKMRGMEAQLAPPPAASLSAEFARDDHVICYGALP